MMTANPDLFKQMENYLKHFIPVNEEEILAFSRNMKELDLKKGSHLLDIGETCNLVAFIAKGVLRYYYVVGGEEHTVQFFFENSFASDMESFISGAPAKVGIDALENSKLLVIPKKDILDLYKTYHKFEHLGRLMAEAAYMGLRKKTNEFLNMSAEERYLNLIKERPKVMERIPQHYIASYLGIKPQSLSRIRKNL